MLGRRPAGVPDRGFDEGVVEPSARQQQRHLWRGGSLGGGQRGHDDRVDVPLEVEANLLQLIMATGGLAEVAVQLLAQAGVHDPTHIGKSYDLGSSRHEGQVAGGSAADLSKRPRSEEHTSELQSQSNLVCRLLLEKK